MLKPRKTYIQNCTGAHLKNEKKKSNIDGVNRILSKIIFYVLLVCFFVVTGYVLFFSPYLKVFKITVKGNKEISSAEIVKNIENYQQEKFLKIFSKENFLLSDNGDMENLLSEKFKKIERVSVRKKFPDTIEIFLQERKALLVLCSQEECFMVDENGIAYGQADFYSQELIQNNLIKITDRSSREVGLGQEIMTKEYVAYVSSLKESLQQINISVEDDFWTPSLMAEEVNVQITEKGGQLYFSTQFPLEDSIRILNLILEKEPFKNQKKENIAYIDLRTENKVFYKLNNQPSIENNDSQDTAKEK
ncbi:MAG: FtsQ-type POTRA domain-containing protein [Candidatus Moranbacteria bacterium]|nr:FtsQ-type POTRA domain-containing protein [Candidatus Moranbacteria bacterium]